MKRILTVLIITLLLVSCHGRGKKVSSEDKNISLSAAGATFPMPFYNLAFKRYTELTGIPLTYGGIGSGGGIRSLADKVVDFGATDAFLTDQELSGMPAPIVHIPTCMGAVVIAYNLPGVNQLKMTPDLIADIFLGNISKWNDSKIKAENPGLDLPDKDIAVVHRSDGSGTTNIFSNYLTKVSNQWKEKVGEGKSLEWPVGIGAKGNPGVAGIISQSVGSVGYVGSEYAFAQKISYALVKNSSGNFINPDIESITAAAKGEIPADTRVMVTDSPAPDAYPISGFTWIILYKEQSYDGRTFARAQATVRFLEWLINPDAQAIAISVNYAPLPPNVSSLALKALGTITFDGKPVLN